VEDFDLSEYDLVISSSAALSKGVITGADQPHIAYVHSPARYAWDMMHIYLKQSNLIRGPKALFAKYILHKFRIWDYRTANGVDHFIANSKFISRRITKVYRRDSEVIYPPVEIDRFSLHNDKSDYYLTASRMVPYKRIDLIVKAFTLLPHKKLVVIGDGPEMKKIAAIAQGHSNIGLLGYQNNQVLVKYMQEAKAFVFAAEEDFGIVPVEVQACGTPVIAYGAGGALETVIGYDNNKNHATGIFFQEQTPQSIVKGIDRFEKIAKEITPQNCRANAERFSPEIFRERLKNSVQKTYEAMKMAQLS
jgi:glycosyltransferase involved in cell wall biosynthesis